MYFVNEGGTQTILLLQVRTFISFVFNKIGLKIK
jgi:hypothetical protein